MYRQQFDPAPETVSIVCVTSRPHLLDQLIEAVRGQTHLQRELILVTNSDRYSDIDVEARVERLADQGCLTTVLRRPADRSLGACLNDGMDATGARFVAKFDDDDLYGPQYLADSLRAFAYSGAGVVGKHTYYAYLAGGDRTVLRFPTREFSYSSTLAGGTLMIDRHRTGSLRFADVSIAEDRSFLAQCHRRGISTFSADRFNFVQVRAGDNTWTVGDDDFVVRAVPVADGLPIDSINI